MNIVELKGYNDVPVKVVLDKVNWYGLVGGNDGKLLIHFTGGEFVLRGDQLAGKAYEDLDAAMTREDRIVPTSSLKTKNSESVAERD